MDILVGKIWLQQLSNHGLSVCVCNLNLCVLSSRPEKVLYGRIKALLAEFSLPYCFQDYCLISVFGLTFAIAISSLRNVSAVKDLETAQLSRVSEHSDGSSAHRERGFPAVHSLANYRAWPVSDWGLDSGEWVTAALSPERISPWKPRHHRPAGPICWRQSSPATLYPGLQAFLGPLVSAFPTSG